MRTMRTGRGTPTNLEQRHGSCGIGARKFVAEGSTSRMEPMRRPHARATIVDPTPEGVGKNKSDDMRVRADGWRVRHRSRNTTTNRKKKRMGRGSNILARLFPRLRYRYQPPCLRPVPVSAGPWCGCNNRCELENNSTRRRKIRKRRRNVREWADSSPSLSSDSDTNLQENGRRPILNTVFIKFIKNHTTKQVLIQRY